MIFSLERSQPMEPTKPKLPSEAVELYNLFIHGVISRRTFWTACSNLPSAVWRVRDCRGVDAELRRGPAGLQER